MSLPIKIISAVICDQVRKEDNGKLILIGAYGGTILVPLFPYVIPLSLVLWIRPPAKETRLDFRVLVGRKTLAKGEVVIMASGDNDTAIAIFPNIPVNIEQAEAISFQMKSASGKWATVLEAKTRLNPASSSVTPPPSSQSPTAS